MSSLMYDVVDVRTSENNSKMLFCMQPISRHYPISNDATERSTEPAGMSDCCWPGSGKDDRALTAN